MEVMNKNGLLVGVQVQVQAPRQGAAEAVAAT